MPNALTDPNPVRSRQQYLDTYALSHMNPANQAIHLICVPAIFAATVGLAWLVPIGSASPWLNLATLGALPVLGSYARLGLRSFSTGLLWLALSIALCVATGACGALLLWIASSVWIAAWIVQVYGHHLEGAKPSFLDDLLFLLIGPLFVQQKLQCRISARRLRVP